jgi:hypothetical protein
MAATDNIYQNVRLYLTLNAPIYVFRPFSDCSYKFLGFQIDEMYTTKTWGAY